MVIGGGEGEGGRGNCCGTGTGGPAHAPSNPQATPLHGISVAPPTPVCSTAMHLYPPPPPPACPVQKDVVIVLWMAVVSTLGSGFMSAVLPSQHWRSAGSLGRWVLLLGVGEPSPRCWDCSAQAASPHPVGAWDTYNEEYRRITLPSCRPKNIFI